MENKTKSKFDHTELSMNFTEMKCYIYASFLPLKISCNFQFIFSDTHLTTQMRQCANTHQNILANLDRVITSMSCGEGGTYV